MTALCLRFFLQLGVLLGILAPEAIAFIPTKQLVGGGFVAASAKIAPLSRNCDRLTETGENGHATLYHYDSINRLLKYDGLHRLVEITYPDGTYTQTSYSSTNLPWKTRDELGRETETEYDMAGRAIVQKFPQVDRGDNVLAHPETHTHYDAAGNVIATINPLGKRWDFVYDTRHRKI